MTVFDICKRLQPARQLTLVVRLQKNRVRQHTTMPTDDPYWNWLRQDAAAFRTEQWEYRLFRSVPALFTRDGKLARPYDGEPFDSTEWELRERGWDHEHCRFCNLCICDGEDDHLKAGYTSEGEWLCPTCYQRIVVAGEDPEDVLREAGWQ